jgi:hypothetical protein
MAEGFQTHKVIRSVRSGHCKVVDKDWEPPSESDVNIMFWGTWNECQSYTGSKCVKNSSGAYECSLPNSK